MKIQIDDKILEKYPNAEIGYLAAHVSVDKSAVFVEELKESLLGKLQEKGIHATNFAVHPHVSIWRKIYKEDFRVKEPSYRSSLEALVRRLVTGKAIWNISNVVDLYNCCSVLSLLPMGGYDMAKLSGGIAIRYAKEGEAFHGIGARLKVEIEPHHVVYADDQRVLSWLWNHKDAQETCIDENTKRVLFFIDSADGLYTPKIPEALKLLAENLRGIHAIPIGSGVLNREISEVDFD